jgi:hypothetical protein
MGDRSQRCMPSRATARWIPRGLSLTQRAGFCVAGTFVIGFPLVGLLQCAKTAGFLLRA